MAKGMTTTEAATHLGVTDRSVREYVTQGLLTVAMNGRKRMLDPVEVEELRLDRASSKKGRLLPAAELQLLRSKVRRLEAQMALINTILDAKNQPLGVVGTSASQLYEACRAQVRRADWGLEELAPWSDILLRLTEDDFVEIEATSIEKPWKPFLQLVSLMMGYVRRLPEYRTSLELQTLHKTFGEAKRRLRVSTTLFLESRVGASEEMERYLHDSPSSLQDSLARALKI